MQIKNKIIITRRFRTRKIRLDIRHSEHPRFLR